MREIPKVKPSMGAWERESGGKWGREGQTHWNTRGKVAEEEERCDEGKEGYFWSTELCFLPWPCGSLAWWFRTKLENHIARDYYTAMVTAATLTRARRGYTHSLFWVQGECHTFLHLLFSSWNDHKKRICFEAATLWIVVKGELFWGKMSVIMCLWCVVCICCVWSGAELSQLLNRESWYFVHSG